jgi:hypothetical protein
MKGVVVDYSQFQVIANGLLNDTTITVEAQVANAADSVAVYQVIVEPIA